MEQVWQAKCSTDVVKEKYDKHAALKKRKMSSKKIIIHTLEFLAISLLGMV